MQETAELAAGGLAGPLAARPGCPLVCLNIGGGAGADSWNALLLLLSSRPALLIGREVLIIVLDVDEAGPAFGAARSKCSGRLARRSSRWPTAPARDVRLVQCWLSPRDPDGASCRCRLCRLVRRRVVRVRIGSEIVDNLRELRAATPPVVVAVGTVTRESAATRASRSSTRVATVPRSTEAFGELAEAAGWVVESAVARPFLYNVRLFPRE